MNGPFHDGEIAVQQLAGERDMAVRVGRALHANIPYSGRMFLPEQTTLAVASADQEGAIWASVLFGAPGMASANDDGSQLHLDLRSTVVSPQDSFWQNIGQQPRLGILGIDLLTRRRLRVNGLVGVYSNDRLVVVVDEAFPNCPKYIQRRKLVSGRPQATSHFDMKLGSKMTAQQIELVHGADTMFVASVNKRTGLDVSHRGGPTGFIEVIGDRRLRIPDYAGNSMFQTLGNIHTDSRAGIAIIDFASSSMLQLAGSAQIAFNQPDPLNRTGGTGRFWEFDVQQIRQWSLPIKATWEFMEFSPFNPSGSANGERTASLPDE